MGGDVYDFGVSEAVASAKEVGLQLQQEQSTDSRVRILRRAVTVLEEMQQEDSMAAACIPLIEALSKPQIQASKDKGTQIYSAACFVNILRISAPEAPFDVNALQVLVRHTTYTFRLLKERNHATFSLCLSTLRLFAKIKCGVLLWDLPDETLAEGLCQTLMDCVTAKNYSEVSPLAVEIMSTMFEEADDIPQNIIEMILGALECPDLNQHRTRMLQDLLRHQEATLGVSLQKSLTHVIELGGGQYKNYERIMLAIHTAVPQLLLPVLPHLAPQLEDEDEAKRKIAVTVAGHLFSQAEAEMAGEYPELFKLFLRRFVDNQVEVRLSALGFANDAMAACSSETTRNQVMETVCGRQIDPEERVRALAISVVCSSCCREPTLLPQADLSTAVTRLRDSKLLVRKEAASSLCDLFAASFRQTLDGLLPDSVVEDLYSIPEGVILNTACDPDRSLRELSKQLLRKRILPSDATHEEASIFWARLYAGSEERSQKALMAFLSHTERFQDTVAALLQLRQRQQHPRDGVKELPALAKRVAEHVQLPKAEDQLRKLIELRDNNIFRALERLASGFLSSEESARLQGQMLPRIAPRGGLREFVAGVAARLQFSPFQPGHLTGLLTLATSLEQDDTIQKGAMDLLADASEAAPRMFTGVSQPVLELLRSGNDDAIVCASRIVASAGPSMSSAAGSKDQSSAWVETLGEVCQGGPAEAAKPASRALARHLAGLPGGEQKMDDLLAGLLACARQAAISKYTAESGTQLLICLVSTAEIGRHHPGVMASRASELKALVMDDLLPMKLPRLAQKACWASPGDCVSLKTSALKALARALVPVTASKDAALDSSFRGPVTGLLSTLDRLLDPGTDLSKEVGISGKPQQGHIRLAAASAMLRLARRHDLLIPSQMYINLGLTAQDPLVEVRSSFIAEVVKTVNHFEAHSMHTAASKYIATLSLSGMDPSSANRKCASAELRSFVSRRREAVWEASASSACSSSAGGTNLQAQPEFALPYAIYLLAHHPDFPEKTDIDRNPAEELEPWRKMLHFLLTTLLEPAGHSEGGASLPAIFKTLFTIKLSGDSMEASVNRNVCAVCDLALMMCGAKERLRSLPPFPAKVPLPKALYQRVDRTMTVGHGVVGSHLPRSWEGPEALPVPKSGVKHAPKRSAPARPEGTNGTGQQPMFVLPDPGEGSSGDSLAKRMKSAEARQAQTLQDIPVNHLQ